MPISHSYIFFLEEFAHFYWVDYLLIMMYRNFDTIYKGYTL